MVFTFEDSIANRKNPADAEKCAVKLLNHFNKHLKPFPNQEPKITNQKPKIANRETLSNMIQCVEIMCAIGLGPIMHQIFDAVSEEQEKLGRIITQDEAYIIIRRAFEDYKPKENAANDISSKEDIILKV